MPTPDAAGGAKLQPRERSLGHAKTSPRTHGNDPGLAAKTGRDLGADRRPTSPDAEPRNQPRRLKRKILPECLSDYHPLRACSVAGLRLCFLVSRGRGSWHQTPRLVFVLDGGFAEVAYRDVDTEPLYRLKHDSLVSL